MRGRYIFLLVVGVIGVIVGGSLFGYGTWNNSRNFVSTSNAQVVADLIQVGSNNAGRIVTMNVDVGAPITQGQVIATVDIATVISRSDTTGTAKIGFRDVQDQRADVLAPRSGVIAALRAKEGETVPAGQPIVTLMDPSEVWIVANIGEGKINRIRTGQIVEVNVDSFGRTLAGRVDILSPVTAASLQPGRSDSTSFDTVSQVVPIKIILDGDHSSLIPGSTADVKIRVR